MPEFFFFFPTFQVLEFYIWVLVVLGYELKASDMLNGYTAAELCSNPWKYKVILVWGLFVCFLGDRAFLYNNPGCPGTQLCKPG